LKPSAPCFTVKEDYTMAAPSWPVSRRITPWVEQAQASQTHQRRRGTMPGDRSTLGVEGQVEDQDIHAWLAQEAELPALSVLVYQRLHVLLGYPSRPSHA
jgi:hypothetical protein